MLRFRSPSRSRKQNTRLFAKKKNSKLKTGHGSLKHHWCYNSYFRDVDWFFGEKRGEDVLNSSWLQVAHAGNEEQLVGVGELEFVHPIRGVVADLEGLLHESAGGAVAEVEFVAGEGFVVAGRGHLEVGECWQFL